MIDLRACLHCGEIAQLVTGREIYPHRPDLFAKSFWRCVPCRAHVGCHGLSSNPLGRPADNATRAARMRAHAFFDPVWKSRMMLRREAYSWLAGELGIESGACHISWFDAARCQDVVEAVMRLRAGSANGRG